MRIKRSASIAVLAISLIMLLALPGGAASLQAAQPAEPGSPEALALEHVRKNAGDFGGGAADAAELVVGSTSTSTHNGVTHVSVGQLHESLPVFGGQVTVNIQDGEVLHAGGTLVSVARKSGTVDNDAVDAVEAAADELDLDEPEDLEALPIAASAPGQALVSDGGIAEQDIPAQLGWHLTGKGLRLAWQVVIDDAADVHLWDAIVDAESGAVLDVEDWTSDDSHDELSSTLARGEHQFEGAHAAGAGTHVAPNPVEDGSSYRVLDMPKESPNDAGLSVVTNPADGLASPFGWHDTDGAPGAEHTTTRGNNVHAYLDQDGNNQPDPGQDVDGGSSLDFLFPTDFAEHAQANRAAAVTNLFYWNNIIHDVTYRYGFDEEAGNFQANNYGRGGADGDHVNAEAMDGGGTNNANFNPGFSDGTNGRMQMYLWPGNQFGAQNGVTVGDETFDAGWARFGPPATNAGVSGALFVAAGNGCAAGDYAGMPAGAVAIADGVTGGAGCSHVDRTRAAADAGADALVVASTSTSSSLAILSGSQADGPVAIPAVSVTMASGNALKALVGQSATVHKSSTHPGIRDGDFENGIIIHEYGHGVSIRLVGGPDRRCLSGAEQMGEGWSDYLAVSMLLDPALDDPERPRGMGPYALFQDSREGGGIRTTPYSRNMTINPFTYDNIQTEGYRGRTIAAPHQIGWGWASILWDMTWDLIDRHGFHDNLYDGWSSGGNTRAFQYVMDGMKMQECYPGYLDARDTILAASEALGGEDTCLIWGAFARRGLGHSAVQGSSGDRNDNSEAFDVPSECHAPGAGFVGPQVANDQLNTTEAGETQPVLFRIDGHPLNGQRDILKANHSPSVQQIDCDTRQPLPGQDVPEETITVPAASPGSSGLSYARGQDRYHWNWDVPEDWAGTCRQLIITLQDGKQLRTDFRIVAG